MTFIILREVCACCVSQHSSNKKMDIALEDIPRFVFAVGDILDGNQSDLLHANNNVS